MANTSTVYNLTLTNANTEYSQQLPRNCTRFKLQARTAVEVRWAFETGKVAAPTAPYLTLKSGGTNEDADLAQRPDQMTLYFASGSAGTVVEIVAWN